MEKSLKKALTLTAEAQEACVTQVSAAESHTLHAVQTVADRLEAEVMLYIALFSSSLCIASLIFGYRACPVLSRLVRSTS